jgi:hypothetical protein
VRCSGNVCTTDCSGTRDCASGYCCSSASCQTTPQTVAACH